MVLVSHVISQDHVIKVKNYIMVRNRSRYVTILPSLVATGIVAVEI